MSNFNFKRPNVSFLNASSPLQPKTSLKRPNLLNTSLNESIYSVNFPNRKVPKLETNNGITPLAKQVQVESEVNLPNTSNFRIFGTNTNERTMALIGNVESVIKWNKILENQVCLFEVIARVVSLQEGTIQSQKIMLLRDQRGPILRVIYYNTTYLNINVEQFHLGQILRCVGHMKGQNTLNAFSIRTATVDEIETLQRNCLISERAIARLFSL